jgi:hypothetical protein
MSKLCESADRDVALSALDATDVGPVHARALRQSFLAKTELLASTTDRAPKG